MTKRLSKKEWEVKQEVRRAKRLRRQYLRDCQKKNTEPLNYNAWVLEFKLPVQFGLGLFAEEKEEQGGLAFFD